MRTNSKPTGTKPAGTKTATGQTCCQAIATTMIGHFVTRLEVEARKAGGHLDADQIHALAQRFVDAEQSRFGPVYQRSFDDCTAAREAEQWGNARRRPFDRILMKRFAHLFPARNGDDGGSDVLSRRMIAGFNLTIDKMIGPTLYEQCQRKSQAILDRHALPSSGWDWGCIYGDPEAQALANDVLVVVAHYFGAFDKRRTWFMDLINSHLSPASPGDDDEHWLFGESAFSELMHALFADLHAAMLTNPKAVRARYGDNTFDTLREFLTTLDKG
jgi:hypothetical protein